MEPESQNTNNNSQVVVNGAPVAATQKKFSAGGGKKRLVLIGVVMAVLVIGGVFAWMWLRGEDISTETPVASVTISSEGFVPKTIQIEKDQEVAWVNEDENEHKVYAIQEDVPGLDSTEMLAHGDYYIYTFEEAGTFNYYDPKNPKLTGTVIVKE